MSIEAAPGIRHNPIVGDVHVAYFRDPDGNKLGTTYCMPPRSGAVRSEIVGRVRGNPAVLPV